MGGSRLMFFGCFFGDSAGGAAFEIEREDF